MAKIQNFYSFGAVFPHFFPDKREFLQGGADLWSAPPCQISRLSEQRVAPAGEKPIFGPLSKNNTGMAALRAGLPVTIYCRRIGCLSASEAGDAIGFKQQLSTTSVEACELDIVVNYPVHT